MIKFKLKADKQTLLLPGKKLSVQENINLGFVLRYYSVRLFLTDRKIKNLLNLKKLQV